MDLFIHSLGEMLGTFILVLLGNGVGFSVNHRKMFANQSGKWIVICFGWAIAVFLGAFAAAAVGAPGHLNPAASIFYSFYDYQVLLYIPFQVIGAILAQTLLYLLNWNFIKDEALSLEGNKFATRGSTCTNPAFDGKSAYASNFGYEFVATAILIMVLFIFEEGHVQKPDLSVGTISIISLTIIGIGFSLGSATGFAINPARDLGPRIVYQLLRKTKTCSSLVDANWQYSWIPVIAPALAGLFFGVISLA